MKNVFKAINKLNIVLRILIYAILIFGCIALFSCVLSTFGYLL